MKIIMEKRKAGAYAQWFVVYGFNPMGRHCCFLIFAEQAKNYAQAVIFWNKTWGKTCRAYMLMNAEPFDNTLSLCC